uniref:MarR family winged helix-turn-helix transcriptional regulator n=1 Tax=Thaumasiovibrio occultus TaxID=1891184 RepID=UPI000B363169|nr:MarR family transcriptional regulator [Thaumasiovibrio occultus]
MRGDKVDTILQQWQQVRPDLECSAMGIIGRVRRTSHLWSQKMDALFKTYGLSSIEFDLLATMRRSGDEPVTPTALYQTLMLSSGAVSTRVEQLVQRGLVARVASENDRRSCKLALTSQGIALIDEVVNAHVANLDNLVEVLDNDEQEQLAALLRKILIASE